jgi:hypothetical protein
MLLKGEPGLDIPFPYHQPTASIVVKLKDCTGRVTDLLEISSSMCGRHRFGKNKQFLDLLYYLHPNDDRPLLSKQCESENESIEMQ